MSTPTSFNTVNGKCCCNCISLKLVSVMSQCFNTVNGKSCCNMSIFMKMNVPQKWCFNTVNSKGHCLITFVLPSLRSCTCDVRTSSSPCSSAVSHPTAHTVNDKYCCNTIEICLWNTTYKFQYRKQ